MHRAQQHLNNASKHYHNAWQQVELMRRDMGVDLPTWPAWCFLPMAGWYSIISAEYDVPVLSPQQAQDIANLAAIGTWRYTQGIYRFDEYLRDAIANTIVAGDLPVEVLYRLPEWCIYIEHQGEYQGAKYAGFWAHLECDMNDGRHELRLLIDTDSGFIPAILHLGKHTVTEAVDRALSEANRQAEIAGTPTLPPAATEQLTTGLHEMISLVLYICSDRPEYNERDARPQRPKPKKTKKGWRLFAPNKPRIWALGAETGEKLRCAKTDYPADRKGRSPHIRRAHWHGFWSGPRDGKQKFNYKWLPPMLVEPTEKKDESSCFFA